MRISEKYVLTFPLLTLTKTDTDVLRASLNSLKSSDIEVTLAGVHFFEEVILQDFPAEIFLQRTAFVEAISVVPADLRTQFSMALLDTSLLCTPCDLDRLVLVGLPAYVALFNSAILSLWQMLINLQRSMRALVQYLRDFEAIRDKKIEIPESLMDMAVEGGNALEIIGSTHFASTFVQFLNEIFWFPGLSTLHHNVNSTNVDIVANPTKPNNGLEFVLRDEILCELIEFGLQDNCVEIHNLTERILVRLLNGYAILPQATWKALRRLILLRPACADPLPDAVRPLSISLGPYAQVYSGPDEQDTLGALALDWCLGQMTPDGRRLWHDRDRVVERSITDSSASDEVFEQVIMSCCRLLMHPAPEVRLRAAVVVCDYIQQLWRHSVGMDSRSRFSQFESVRQIEGASVTSEPRSATAGNTGSLNIYPPVLLNGPGISLSDSKHKTSTPLLDTQNTVLNTVTDKLANIFIPTAYDSSGTIPAPPLLDQHDVPVESTSHCEDQKQLDGLLHVMQLFSSSDSDLGVRRAAGEQIAILVKRELFIGASPLRLFMYNTIWWAVAG
ncbi:unnamed protein product [Echinostoma caproni]|uniref:Non-specific serine/threonine protein kinase n=1 Tax=Echinostoma caproni TaxID=27848 RepID=A0A183APV8_9TREM|nr:unnamed protein product [Echinostoma caproni]